MSATQRAGARRLNHSRVLRRAPVAPIDGCRVRVEHTRIHKQPQRRSTARRAQVELLPLVHRLVRSRYQHRRHILDEHTKRLRSAAAVVVRNADRNRIGSVVGIHVRTTDRTGSDTGKDRRVLHRRTVAPVNRGRVRVGQIGIDIERQRRRTARSTQIKRLTFVDLLIRSHHQHRRHVSP